MISNHVISIEIHDLNICLHLQNMKSENAKQINMATIKNLEFFMKLHLHHTLQFSLLITWLGALTSYAIYVVACLFHFAGCL